jgi:hypothetical protein
LGYEGNAGRTVVSLFLQTVDIGLTSGDEGWGTIRAGSGTTDPDHDLHALRHREGMGKPA